MLQLLLVLGLFFFQQNTQYKEESVERNTGASGNNPAVSVSPVLWIRRNVAVVVIIRQVLSQEVQRQKAGSCKVFHVTNNSKVLFFTRSCKLTWNSLNH